MFRHQSTSANGLCARSNTPTSLAGNLLTVSAPGRQISLAILLKLPSTPATELVWHCHKIPCIVEPQVVGDRCLRLT